LRPIRRVAPAVLTTSVLLAPGGAVAYPSHSGGTGLFDVLSAHVPVAGSGSLGLAGVAYRVLDQDEPGRFGDRDVVDGGLRGSLSLWDRVEAWGACDFAYTSVDRASATSVRDGLLGAKLAIPSRVPWIETAVAGRVNLPWGKRSRGFSTGAWDPSVSALVSFHLPESNALTYATAHLNVGYTFHGDDRGRGFPIADAGMGVDLESFPTYYLEPVYPKGDNDRLELRAAIELGSEKLGLFAELLLDQLPQSDHVSFRESPIFLTPGFRYSISESFGFMVTSKIALAADDPATTKFPSPESIYPDWQLGFSLAWSRFGRNVDRDQDGVPDVRDRCPRDPEDRDGWEDEDGCPDLDNDGDGVADRFDGAPNNPEDVDGYLDSDGVPDPDNDGDGLLDLDDGCPDEAEDMDGIQDADGCPETDADGDGVPDAYDGCPELAAPEGGLGGCPEGKGIEAPFELPGVTWKGLEVAPEPGSFVSMQGLLTRLQRSTSLGVELRVDGNDRDLATRRADYLKGFFAQQGIAADRVVAKPGKPGEPKVIVVPIER